MKKVSSLFDPQKIYYTKCYSGKVIIFADKGVTVFETETEGVFEVMFFFYRNIKHITDCPIRAKEIKL